MDNKVIVFGSDHYNTLGVIRSLGESGIKPYVVICCKGKSFVSKSKYIERVYLVENESEGIELIFSTFGEEMFKPIIFCTSDLSAHTVDKTWNKLSLLFYCPNAAAQGRINFLMNKENIRKIAEEVGLKTPKSFIVNKTEIVPYDIIYPCITKPLLSIYSGKDDIHICNGRNRLISIVRTAKSDILHVQEFIKKRNELLLMGCVLANGTVVIPGFAKYKRMSEDSYGGFFSYLPITPSLNSLISMVETLILKTQYKGLFSVEFLETNDGEYLFMEMNFRNDAFAYAVTSAGVNLPNLFYKSHCGKEIPEEDYIIKRDILAMNEFLDLHQSLLSRKISLFNWIKDVMSCNCFLFYNKYDISPFLFLIYVKVKSFFGKNK